MIGQIIVGSPGSGKTSFCCLMKKIIYSTEETPVLVNLDPGNNILISISDINIQELIFSDEIMPEINMGPNGSILYAMEYFEQNYDWFENKLKNFITKFQPYHFIFDFPGQIELFTHHYSIRYFVKRILSFNIKLVVLNLSDSFFYRDKTLNTSLMLICTSIMLNIELPHFHILSKSDLFQEEEKKQIKYTSSKNFNYNFFKSCQFWSNLLYFDLKNSILGFSIKNDFQVSIFYPQTLNIIYQKIKKITL